MRQKSYRKFHGFISICYLKGTELNSHWQHCGTVHVDEDVLPTQSSRLH